VFLTGKELAAALNRHPGYVSAMRSAGFTPTLPPNLFTLADAIAWLQAHPDFRSTAVYPCKLRRSKLQQSEAKPKRLRRKRRSPIVKT
jgi:hypothetical protein